MQSGVPNRFGIRQPVKSNWIVQLMDSLLSEYHEREIIEWLTYGFPVSWEGDEYPVPAETNHLGATRYSEHIDEYLKTKIEIRATIGPFTILLFFRRIGISPLLSRPKRGSDSRRVILDISFPFGQSVSDGKYCGDDIKLMYPTINKLVECIM